MKLNRRHIADFKKFIWNFYAAHGRSFLWRKIYDPYYIFISEVMLQQTQTDRVQKKFELFLSHFPDFSSLAAASLREVLAIWSGLGYNRRAIYLHKSAQLVVDRYAGALPADPEILITFPGIGKATAASICAFAFNMPTVFIETNIRAVFIDAFFKKKDGVFDVELMPLIAATVCPDNPREWYYALMDYGVFLKKNSVNPSRKSKHHIIQSKFEGSDRQIRGAVLRALLQRRVMSLSDIISVVKKDPERTHSIINQLCLEGFIMQDGQQFALQE